MKPSINSEKQLTSLERTWRSNCRAHALVISPCIVCKGEMSSSPRQDFGKIQLSNLIRGYVHESRWHPTSTPAQIGLLESDSNQILDLDYSAQLQLALNADVPPPSSTTCLD
jgi:hypothetical protein